VLPDTLAQLKELADKCADAPTWPLSDDALVECLNLIHQATQTLAATELHLIREIDGRGLPTTQHAASTPAWLREHLRISITTAKRKVDLARTIDHRPALDTALASAAVNVEQASVVAAAVRDLPTDLDPELVDRAEAVLIAQASQFEPSILRKSSERILLHIAPEIAEAADAAALARQETQAWQSRAFQLTRHGDGRVRVTGWLD
jgi:hypothetical protein